MILSSLVGLSIIKLENLLKKKDACVINLKLQIKVN